MINLISGLFRSCGYTANNLGDDILFSENKMSARTDFWLIVQAADLKLLLDKQSELFAFCKQSISDAAVDKNLSMLILWDTGGALKLGEMKKKVMSIEEDTYFFKKHVLYYSTLESDSLKEVMSEEPFHEFFQKHIASQEVFEKYKQNPLSQGWQPLLCRIAIKIPFLDIHIGLSDNLDSLFENNTKKIKAAKDKGLMRFNQHFFEVENTDEPTEEYLAALLPGLLEEKSNGN